MGILNINPTPTIPAPLPSSGTSLSVRGFPQVPFAIIQGIQTELINLASPFTLQAALMNGLTGGASLQEMQADLASLPTADLPTDAGTQAVIAQVVAAIVQAYSTVGPEVSPGVYAPGPGFNSWRATVGDASLPVSQGGAQYQIVFRQVS